jgi:hypothetical protein
MRMEVAPTAAHSAQYSIDAVDHAALNAFANGRGRIGLRFLEMSDLGRRLSWL